MRRKQSLICSALSIASILSMSVPAMAAEPVDVPDVAAAETRVVEETASMKVGDVIDLGDGFTAVVKSVSEVVRPGNSRIEDTFFRKFDDTLDLYYGSHWVSTLRAVGSIDYSPSGRWVHFNTVDVYPSSGEATVQQDPSIRGEDTARTSATFKVYSVVNRTVTVSASYSGSISFSEN